VAAPFQMVHMTWLLEDVTRSFTHQLVRYRVGTAYTQQSLRFHGAEPIRIRRSNDSARFEQSAKDAVRNYWQLRNEGVHPQFARGILPLDTVSWIWFSCSFASLQHIFRQRMTVQAQPGEWQEVLTQMHDLLPANLRPFLRSCCTSGGPCPFASMWDRPCPGRPDSQAQHPAGAKIAEQALENIGG
jgi:thymidylate synthase ThyX